jgi:hypothetical protein
METIEDIIAELREHSGETLPPWVIFNEDGGLDVTLFADRIEAAVKAYNKEITELLLEVIGGVCLHCDLQTSCQEGEDEMSTTCNAVAKATHFINQHTEPESGKDLPF